jgi:hypothetical protein
MGVPKGSNIIISRAPEWANTLVLIGSLITELSQAIVILGQKRPHQSQSCALRLLLVCLTPQLMVIGVLTILKLMLPQIVCCISSLLKFDQRVGVNARVREGNERK